MLALGLQLVVPAAAALAHQLRPLGDDVGGVLGGDGADVGGGLLVNAQQLHVGDGLAQHLHGADPLLGGYACVGPAADDGGAQFILAGGGGDDLPCVAAAVQYGGLLGGDAAVVHVAGAPQAHLLADGEQSLDSGVGQVLLHDGAQNLYNGGDARLVIPAQHSVPAAADNAVLNNGLHPHAGDHGVHVGGEEDGLPFGGAGEGAVQVARLAARLLAAVVHIDLAADGLQVLRDPGGHGPLVGAFAVNLHIV